MVATSPVSSRLLSGPPGELVLRVRGPGREGQIVRLQSAKCSIGSGARCTLRLDARGVRPVHCVLLRGSQRTIARRWAPDTRLNGNAFGDAELRPGDRLSIGPIELDVLETGASPVRRDSRDTVGTDARLLKHQQDLAREQAELAAQRERFQQEQAEWRRRQEAAEQALNEREDAVRQAAGLSQDVAHEQAELAAAWARLEKERAEWRDRQEAAGQALREKQESLQQRQDEIDRGTADIQHEQETLRLDREKFERQLAEERSRPATEHPGLADAQVRRETEQAPLDQADTGAESDASAAKEVKEEAPVDLADVLRRLGKANLLRTDDNRDDEPDAEELPSDRAATPRDGPVGAPGHSTTSDAANPSSELAPNDDEVSVDEYMSQLMQRVRGGTPQPLVSGTPRASGQEGHSQKVETDQTSPTAPPATPAPRKPARLKPRGPAPERTGFAAMRELANVSARSAVDQHARRQMVAVSRSKLAVAATAIVAGLILSWLWTTHAHIGVTLLAAITSFAVGLFWALQYAVVTGRLLVGRSGFLSFRRSAETVSRATGDGAQGESRE